MAGGSTTGPGGIRVQPGELEINADRGPAERGELTFTNTADRPIQIGSHLHLARGQRRPAVRPGRGRGVPAGHPGRHVAPIRTRGVPEGGHRRPEGPEVGTRHSDPVRQRRDPLRWPGSPGRRTRRSSARRPGDQIRLGDTDLWIEVEQDLTFGGEESVFGGGKSIRESDNAGLHHLGRGRPDTVITNVIILDHWGIVRADVGIRDGRIVGVGPQRQPRHRRRGAPGAADRAVHRRDLRRGQDPHRRRLRHPRALPLPVADRRGAGGGADHAGWRRHRSL